MSKIEWERQPDGIIAGHADFVRYQAYEGEQETWQRIHNARVTEIAAANGYVKLQPGQIVVDTKVWLPYLVKAINAAKILQNHRSFTVKHYHGDWPSLEMLEGLKGAIDGQLKDGK